MSGQTQETQTRHWEGIYDDVVKLKADFPEWITIKTTTTTEGLLRKQTRTEQTVICDVCGDQTTARLDTKWLYDNIEPHNPKINHPADDVIANFRYKALTNRIATASNFMDGFALLNQSDNEASAGTASNARWTVPIKCLACNREDFIVVNCTHDLQLKRQWSLLEIFTELPHSLTKRQEQAIASQININQYKTPKAYMAYVEALYDDYRNVQPIVKIEPRFQSVKYATKLAEIAEQAQVLSVNPLKLEIKGQLNEALRLLSKASTSLPDDSDLITIDDSRSGYHPYRPPTQEEVKATLAKRDQEIDQMYAKIRSS
jgi:hypothetical protein